VTCSSMHELEGKLKGLSGLLSVWGKETFGHVCKEVKELKGALADLRTQPNRLGPSHHELKVVEHINELQRMEETMWRQRSRIQWLADGDRNTRFFTYGQARGRNAIVSRVCALQMGILPKISRNSVSWLGTFTVICTHQKLYRWWRRFLHRFLYRLHGP
jgi:hypothetical protein